MRRAIWIGLLFSACAGTSVEEARRDMERHQAAAERAREEGDLERSNQEARRAQRSWEDLRKAQVEQYEDEHGEGPGAPPLPPPPAARVTTPSIP